MDAKAAAGNKALFFHSVQAKEGSPLWVTSSVTTMLDQKMMRNVRVLS